MLKRPKKNWKKLKRNCNLLKMISIHRMNSKKN